MHPLLLPTNIINSENQKPNNDHQKHSQIMEKLKKILFNFTNSNLNNSFTPSQISAIQNNLLHTFSSLKTPTHPAYSSMIWDAIKELNEEGNSTTEEIISERIVRNNEGLLPWAHKRCLKHHLDKLCEIGELEYDSDGGCYDLCDDTRPKRSRKQLRRRFVSGVQDNVVEEEMNGLNEDAVSEELGRGKRKRKRTRSFVLHEEEEDDENEGVEVGALVREGNVEVRSEVLLLENGEGGECRSGDFVVGKFEAKLDVVHSKEGENAMKVLHVAPPLLNIEKSVLKGTKPNPCGTELMIVPYMENLEDSAAGKEIVPLSESKDAVIVCCLPCGKPETPKKKARGYRQRRRSKLTPEKAKALDSSGKRSRGRETKLKWKSQSPKLKGVALLEDGPTKLPEKMETTNPSLLESFSMDDEETLKQVFKKYGNRKKHGMQVTALKDASALASSKASNQLPEKVPSLETSVEMAATVEKELALTKGTEKQLHVQLSLRDKSCDNVEEGAVRKSSSSFLVEKGTNSSEGPDNRRTTYSNSTASCEPDFVNVKHQEKQTQLFCDLQRALDGDSENIVGGPKVQCLEEPSKPMETTDGFTTSSSLVELHQQEVGPSELAGSQIVVEGPKVQCLEEPSKPMETTHGFTTRSLLVEPHQQGVRPSKLAGSQIVVEGPKVQCLEEPSKSKQATYEHITPPLLVELHKQEFGLSELAGSQNIIEGSDVQCLEEPSKSKETIDGLITPSMPVELHEVGPSESPGLQSFVEGPKVQCLDEPSKSKDTTDEFSPFTTPSLPVDLHQQEVGPSELMGCQTIVEGPKVQCLEEPSKSKETTDGLITPSMLVERHQQEAGASESMGSQGIVEGPKIQCLEEALKPKDNTDGFITLSLLEKLHQHEVGPPGPAGHGSSDKSVGAASPSQRSEHPVEDNGEQRQYEVRHEVLKLPVETFVDAKFDESDQYPHQPHKDDQEKENKDDHEKQNQDGQERPLKLTEVTLEDESYLSGYHNRMLEGFSKLTSQEHSSQLENSQLQKRKPGRPRKSDASTVLDAANSSDPSSLHLHKQEATTRATIQSSQLKSKLLKQDGQVRTRQQLANMKDAENLLDPHPREQERLSETENPWRLLNENKQQENVGQGTTGNSKEVSLDIVDPSCLDLKKQQGPDLVSGLRLKQQNKLPKKGGRGRPRIEKEPPICSQERHTKKDNNEEAEDHSEAINNPQSQHHNNKRKRGRPPVQKNMNKDDLGSQNRLQNSRKAYSLGEGVTKGGAAPSNLQCPVQGNTESASHMVQEDDKIPQQGRLPPSKPVTRLSNSQHHQGRLSGSHDHDQAREKMENRLKLPKEMTAKSASILVPLSSKDQLRSRMKRQCQDTT